MKIALFAPAKVNLGLRILGRRSDGYHLLESVFATVSLYDQLEVELGRPCLVKPGPAEVMLTCSPEVVARSAENLVYRAAVGFGDATGIPLKVSVHVRKRIPVGAGLGGGSSDAATVLQFLVAAFPDSLAPADLKELALGLGADVPFFLTGGACRVSGIGETVVPIADELPAHLVLCSDGSTLATSSVFAAYDRALTSEAYPSMNDRPASRDEGFACAIRNDLELAAISLHPGISAMREELLRQGVSCASMTGSGSTVFGVAADERDARRIAEQMRRRGYWSKAVRVVRRRSAIFGRFCT